MPLKVSSLLTKPKRHGLELHHHVVRRLLAGLSPTAPWASARPTAGPVEASYIWSAWRALRFIPLLTTLPGIESLMTALLAFQVAVTGHYADVSCLHVSFLAARHGRGDSRTYHSTPVDL